jgi:UDP-3-O-[3-hydroxymyristoyl] glucosamine N-acyltransferase
MTEITLAELAGKLGGKLVGDGGRKIAGAAGLTAADGTQVSFLANARYEKHMAETSAAAVIVSTDYSGPSPEGVALIRCDDPYFAFREAMVLFYGFRKVDFEGVDERAAVDASARLAEGVAVGPFVTIAGECEIGPGTAIYPGVYVGARCRIGAGCVIYPNVTLYDGTVLHDRVTIHAGTSIGHDGFGYATHKCPDGVVRHDKIPQAGWVEIEDDVEIGACCAIDRATVGPTVIGAGTKFSNLIAIGHGTKMGRHCLMVAQAGIAGSVNVGNYCVFAGQCGIVGHITIGDGVKIGAKAGVTNDIEPGMEVLGSPAVPLAEAKRALVGTSHIPRMRSALRKLVAEMEAVRRRLGMEGGEADEAKDE